MSHRDNPECMREISKQSVKQKAENPKHIRGINKQSVRSSLFKSEGIEVQNAWVDNISSQSIAHEDWTEFVQNLDTSSVGEQSNKIVTNC